MVFSGHETDPDRLHGTNDRPRQPSEGLARRKAQSPPTGNSEAHCVKPSKPETPSPDSLPSGPRSSPDPVDPQVPSPPLGRALQGGVLCAILTLILTGGSFLLNGTVGLNLADEGYLWYGSLRVSAGEVPLRDFQSYDPLRYYWCAGWSTVLGDGVVALRLSVAIFQALGLFCGLLALRRFPPLAGLLPLSLCGLLLVAWTYPRHKGFEVSATMTAIYLSVLLIEKPTFRRFLVSGIFVGLMGFLGRNHGLYNFLGFLAVIGLIAWKTDTPHLLKKASTWFLGLIVGYSPALVMMAFVPGFAKASIDLIFYYMKHGSNIPLPYPWPWALGFEHLSFPERWSVAISFLFPLIFYPAGLLCGLLCPPEQLKRRSLLIASAIVGTLYFHHVTVRSAPGHLAQSIHPLIIAGLTLPLGISLLNRPAIRWSLWGGIAGVLFFTALGTNPDLERFRPGSTVELVPYEVAGDDLRLPTPIADLLSRVEAEVEARVPLEETVFLAPSYTTLYPVLGKKCPVWDIYFLRPNDLQAQKRLLEDLDREGVNWAIIFNAPTDGRRDLLFQNSNPYAWEQIRRKFQRVPSKRLPRHLVLRRANPSPPPK